MVTVGPGGTGPWEDEEMRAALNLAVRDGRPVIPVLLPGAPERVDLPLFLENRTWVDLRGGLAAEGIGRVVWGITGEPPRGGRRQRSAPEQPHYRSERARELSEQLRDLMQRRDDVRAAGGNTEKLDLDVLQVRRDLRTGQPEPGWMLSNGRYLLLEELGHGGFATVWKARDRETDDLVAIKVIHAHLAGDSVRLERFFRGARIMAELDHPGIVRVLEPHGEDQGYHYFVMELMEGGNLHDAVRERRLTGSDAVERVLRVGDALAAAHARGYVHRDVKPQNILLTADGEVRLSDFDLVGAGDTTGGTRTGALGTFAFAAPECLSHAKDATPAADVYSLAMTMVYALTGEDPNPLTMDRSCAHLQCGDATREMLRKAASIEPQERHPTAEELVLGLREAMRRDAPLQPESPPLVAATEADGGRRESDTPRTIIHRETGIELVRIEGGTFLMGAPEGEEGSYDDERPQHRVTLSPFWIGKYPVTNGQYLSYLEENPKAPEPDKWRDPKYYRAMQPVVGVSWKEAARYAEWAGLRLPTEAEWEYACRAATQGRHCSGETEADLDKVGWYRENSGGGIHVVGQKAPNGWGLYDMHGNVWEWCSDWRGKYAADEQRDPVGPASGQDRVFRGGSWLNSARDCRSAQRYWLLPDDRWNNLGFRLAADPR